MTLDAINRGNYLKEYIVERLRYYANRSRPAYFHSWFGRTVDALF